MKGLQATRLTDRPGWVLDPRVLCPRPPLCASSWGAFPTCRMKMALHKMGEVSKKQQEHTRDVRFLQQKLVKIKEVSEAGQSCACLKLSAPSWLDIYKAPGIHWAPYAREGPASKGLRAAPPKQLKPILPQKQSKTRRLLRAAFPHQMGFVQSWKSSQGEAAHRVFSIRAASSGLAAQLH